MVAHSAELVALVASCAHPDGMAALAYLYRHIEAAEAEGLHVKIRPDHELERAAYCPGAHRFSHPKRQRGFPPRLTLAFRCDPCRPWAHLSRETVEEATHSPALMVRIIEDLHIAVRCLRAYRMERLGLEG